ncbi:MAG TPA: molybdopterin-dependent oxidoreductase [Stellaceae bacterium]|nr:molybdopterin-dependent oxidoreductase [Stellaceae bacterium]
MALGLLLSGLILTWPLPAPAQTGQQPATPSAPAGLAVSGRVEHPRALAQAEIEAMPPTTIEVTLKSEHGVQQASFTGTLLWGVIEAAQPIDEPGGRTHLQHTILARGRDGYAVALAIGELDPQFEGKQVLIAYRQDGKPTQGLRLVVPGDARAGRGVRDLVELEVR